MKNTFIFCTTTGYSVAIELRDILSEAKIPVTIVEQTAETEELCREGLSALQTCDAFIVILAPEFLHSHALINLVDQAREVKKAIIVEAIITPILSRWYYEIRSVLRTHAEVRQKTLTDLVEYLSS